MIKAERERLLRKINLSSLPARSPIHFETVQQGVFSTAFV